MPAQQHSDPFEDRVAAELRDAVGQFDADPHALTTAGLARGRRLRLRRRAAVVGGAASLALVGVGGALLLPGGGSDPDPSSVASKPSATATVPPVSGQGLISTLKEQLGYGKFSQETGRGTADAPYAWLVWDDGDGGSVVSVNMERVEPGTEQTRQWTECPDKTFTPYDSCRTSRLDNGSVLRILQGYEYPDKREPTKHWSADLVTPRGQHVAVYEWNAEAEKGSPVTREDPPLDAAELKKLVTAPAWLTAVDAIPKEDKSSLASPEETAPTTDIRKTLVDLLPDGLTPVSRGGDESGWGYVVVDDGKGKSLVEINVQPNMGDLLGESIFEGAEEVGDGTMLITREDAGDKGVSGTVRWTVDTVRINGLRVVVSALNAGGPHDAPSRDKPALTMEQLKKIALSSKWGPSREESQTGQKNSDQG
ncbi:hypothetical protein OG864_20365 [Streptomyces sp. NBC_00124]|uniref:hypothetical protein n=1 Tax=Streptomyces sp. NBC_00124 TaxID=2975662 RepID=UPI002251EEEF|nr:hypothetical protein [Streptomyces sp. NBC_00124]MCX5361064.1 hypothetical protein [Streptomyces sp. NBC_00124]